jgi:hypothetical protein
VQFKGENGFDADSQGQEAGVTLGFYSAVAEHLQRRDQYDVVCPAAAAGSEAATEAGAAGAVQEGQVEHEGNEGEGETKRQQMPVWIQQLGPQSSEFFTTFGGLHPQPWVAAAGGAEQQQQQQLAQAHALERFQFMGRLVAVGLRDGFTVPLPLSVPFLSLVQRRRLSAAALLSQLRGRGDRGEALPSWLVQLAAYEAVAAELDELDKQAAAAAAAAGGAGGAGGGGDGSDVAAAVLQKGRARIGGTEFARARLGFGASLSFDEYVAFEYSEVTFVDPVDPRGSPLMGGGGGAADAAAAAQAAERRVDLGNVREFAALLRDRYLGAGVAAQVEAFRAGVRDFLSLDCLSPFTPVELGTVVAGDDVRWTAASLRRTLQLRGFDWDEDPVVGFLVEELVEMDRERRRQFLQFVTSSPTVPGAGFQVRGRKSAVRHAACWLQPHLPPADAPPPPLAFVCWHICFTCRRRSR